MQGERENNFAETKNGALTVTGMDVGGNDIRLYRDGDGRLVFVLDLTVNSQKPNALLVTDAVAGRKWDDILANDYGVDLERVRPKKDNKYQKLDIEYDGLDVYDGLWRAVTAGGDVSAALGALGDYRRRSARRAAQARLAAAIDTADKARDTIDKASAAIAELKERLKDARSKLSRYRKDVGKVPTKQSAAKILRAEAQIDAINEKLRRARRRLGNAQRRLDTADADAAAARAIIAANDAPVADAAGAATPALVGIPVFREVSDIADEEDIIIEEPKANEMAEDDVKPLFDKDPEILDEEIAFKPIDFDMPVAAPAPSAVTTPARDEVVPYTDRAPAPLSFTPPAADVTVHEERETDASAATSPVLDAMKPVEIPQNIDVVVDEFIPTPVMPAPEPRRPASPAARAPEEQPRPAPSYNAAPEIAPAAPDSDVRPVSPITNAGAAVTPVGGRKNSMAYYIMLIALILLSIFTLWIYQKSANDTVPDLSATPQAETATNDGPFITDTPATPDAATVAAPASEEPAPEPEPAPVVEPEPIVEAPAPEPEAEPVIEEIEEVDAEPVPVPVTEPMPEPAPESPFLAEPEPVVEEPAPVAEPEPVVNKPVYNAGPQSENMFVADENYETDADYYDESNEYVGDGVVYDDQVSGGGYPVDGGREYYYDENVSVDESSRY